jgi:HSP20 family protein
MTNNHAVTKSASDNQVTENGNMNSQDRRAAREEATLMPPVDVIEDATGITLLADLPGVSKDALDVRIDSDTLTIDGRLTLATPQGMTASHAEVRNTRYCRTFTLSKELDAEKVDADFSNGVLRLRIPKAQDAQPRRISVQVH